MVPLTPTSSPSRLGFLQFSPDDPRVLSSGILNTSPIDFSKYPGTGTKIMREFLEKYGDTENIRIKELPEDGKLAKSKEAELFYKVLKSVDSNSIRMSHYGKIRIQMCIYLGLGGKNQPYSKRLWRKWLGADLCFLGLALFQKN
jgi:hypothetical protein